MKKMRAKPLLMRLKFRKMFSIMKMSFILILMFHFSVSATVFSQSYTLKMKNASLEEVLLELQKSASFDVICNSKQILQIKHISIHLENVPINTILEHCLQGTNLSYELIGQTIAIFEKTPQASQKKAVIIQGTILDEKGQPLPGTAIRLKSAPSVGTVTDVDGHFQLSLPEELIGKDALLFSFVGYKTREVTLENKIYQLSMQPEAQALNDVIVTGYQTLSRERATGSYSVLTGNDLSRKLQPDIISRLEGMVPGLTNYKDALHIRGVSTINGVTAPLYVVDGIPYEGSLDAIHPSEIENITVLKDATAASIYGARSANGVIVITTKNGSARKTSVEYNGTVVISPLRDSRDYLNRMDSREFVDWQKELFERYHTPADNLDDRIYLNEVLQLLYADEAGQLQGGELEKQLEIYRNRDNYKELKENFLRNQVTHQHNLAIRGGSDRYRYSASVNYRQNLLDDKASRNERIGYNIKSSYDFFKWLTADLSIIGSNTNSTSANGFNASSYLYGGVPSYQTLFDEQGNELKWYQAKSQKEMDRLTGLGLYDESLYPLQNYSLKNTTNKGNYNNINMAVKAKIIEGLSVDLRYQFEKTFNKSRTLLDEEAHSVRAQVNDASQVASNGDITHLIPEGGQIQETRSDRNSYTLRGQINFNRTIGERHDISAIVGGEVRNIHNTSTYTERYGYDPMSLSYKYIDEAKLADVQSGTEALTGSYTHSMYTGGNTYEDKTDRYVSIYGNASYTFDRRYAVTASIRMDQSNLFGTDPKYQYKPLWSVGLSWHLHNEAFMKDIEWLNRLAIRATRGINGNITKKSGPYMIVEAGDPNSWTGEYASLIKSAPNSGLRWERTNQTNLGIDFGFLGNRLSGTIDWYAKNTSDLLGDIAVDPTTGWNNLTMNYAEMYNHGYEITLNSTNIETKDFRWRTNLNFSYNKNRITNLEVSNESLSSYINGENTRPGMAMGTLFSIRYAGLDEEGMPQAYKKDGTIVKSTKDLKVEDLVQSGTSTPRYSGGMTNIFTYKGFEVSCLFIYYGGHVMRDVMPDIVSGEANYYTVNPNRNITHCWKNPGDEKDLSLAPAYSRSISSNVTNIWYAADRHIRKANYLKLQEITLSYSLPASVLRKAYISGLSIDAQIQNVWWYGSNHRRLNPESWRGTSLSPSLQALNPTVYTLGLSLQF